MPELRDSNMDVVILGKIFGFDFRSTFRCRRKTVRWKIRMFITSVSWVTNRKIMIEVIYISFVKKRNMKRGITSFTLLLHYFAPDLERWAKSKRSTRIDMYEGVCFCVYLCAWWVVCFYFLVPVVVLVFMVAQPVTKYITRKIESYFHLLRQFCPEESLFWSLYIVLVFISFSSIIECI